MAILCLRIACCITNVTNRHSKYVIRITFLLRQWLHENASVLPYTYTTSLVILYIYALLLETKRRLEEYIKLRTKLINLIFHCFNFNWILLYGAISFCFAII